jgi:autotransporter-associated beta strand protein
VDPALGDIEVQQGILEFNGQTASMGDPLHTNTVDAGATLQFTANSVVWNKFFNFNGNGSANTVNNGGSASTELAGPVELHGGVIFNVGGNLLTISSVISGDGSLTKNGTTPMVLTNNNTYTGDTTINSGALRLGGGAGSISNSPNITILSGATLTVTGRVDSTFTLVNNQTVLGNGVINGQLVTLAGSTVSPGLSGIGALTVSNAVTLGGTTLMELNQDAATNDVLNVNSSITYGGVLNLVNVGSPLTNGASFKLFKALSYSGAFASINPATPAAGQTWDTSALSSGIIKVTGSVAGPTTNANITSVHLSGTNIVIHGTNNNVPNTSFQYVVLVSTNLTLPLSSWTPVATNPFVNGTFDYSYPIVPGTSRLFIDVKAVP